VLRPTEVVSVGSDSAPLITPTIAMERTLALAGAVALAAPLSAQVALQDVEITSATAGGAARFGSVVAADGSYAIIGGPDGGVMPSAGMAEIFERAANGTWSSQAVLLGTQTQAISRFGSAVDLDGDVAAVSYGTVELAEVFERDVNGVWNFAQALPKPDANLFGYGRSLAVQGDRLVVTSWTSGFLVGPGAISVFERAGGVFTFDQTVYMPAPGTTTAPQSFGTSVAMDGDVVVVGDPQHNPTGFPLAGRAFVFERQAGGAWLATQTLTAPVVTAGALHGQSVTLDGDRIVIGAPGDFANAGRVYVYERTGTGPFVFQTTIHNPIPLSSSFFGTSVDLNGDCLAIGDPGADTNGNNAGLVRLYERASNGQWNGMVALGHAAPANNDHLGDGPAPIALLDDVLLVGHKNRNSFAGAFHSYSVGGLFHGATEISLASGGSQSLLVRAGEARGGDAFVILGSFSGTSPGIALAPGIELPLVFDAYTNLGLSFSTPVAPSLGVLDGLGRADAAFTVPAGASPSFAGSIIHHAVVTIDTSTFEVGATNAVRLELVL